MNLNYSSTKVLLLAQQQNQMELFLMRPRGKENPLWH